MPCRGRLVVTDARAPAIPSPRPAGMWQALVQDCWWAFSVDTGTRAPPAPRPAPTPQAYVQAYVQAKAWLDALVAALGADRLDGVERHCTR